MKNHIIFVHINSLVVIKMKTKKILSRTLKKIKVFIVFQPKHTDIEDENVDNTNVDDNMEKILRKILRWMLNT